MFQARTNSHAVATVGIATVLMLAVTMVLAACSERNEANPARPPAAPAQSNPVPATASDRGSVAAALTVGCGPVSTADSARLVARGAQLFRTKDCERCHSIGAGDRDGPDLDGVASRQTCEWMSRLLSDTEEMIQTDPELQQLRIEHFLDMPNPNLSATDAAAVYTYMRAASSSRTKQSGRAPR